MKERRQASPFAAGEPLDESAIEWDSVVEATYLIEQELRYDYPGPISDLRHRLVIVPRERHGDQRRLAHRLEVSPDVPAYARVDAFGNPVITVAAPVVRRSIAFELRTLVRRSAAARVHRVPRTMLRDPALLSATALTMPDAALRDAADALRSENRNPFELAHAINRFVSAQMRYVPGSSTVGTTAAEAFAQRSGVCQDYAHVMLALARSCGIASRYVSGHLIGEGATHAWVELILPAREHAVVAGLDPTNDRAVSMKYVVVAVGRDYADVAPTSGSFSGPHAGRLSSRRRVAVTAVQHAA
jgi:transglutaminase-like putative cysteine protease